MKPPKGWQVNVGAEPSSLLAEVLNCHQVWAWLNRRQRTTLLAADDRGHVDGHPRTLRALAGRGLIGEQQLLTEAGRLVLGWNDVEGGPHRERLKSLREQLTATTTPPGGTS